MRRLTACLLVLLFPACGDDDGGGDAGPPADAGPGEDAGPTDDAGGPDAGPVDELGPDGYCPGSTGCATGDGALSVGVAALDITPMITPTTDVQTVDTNGDGEYNPVDGDEFEDRNGNGIYDGIWIAGFGNARAARTVNDPQWVRAIALRSGDTTVVLASIDCIGYFKDEIDVIRGMVSDVDVDFVGISATHSHESRDTLGIWGVSSDSSGVDPAHMAMIRERAAQAIRMAVADLTAARVQYVSFQLRDAPGGVLRYVGDHRDPYILDDTVTVLRFEATADDTTIATLVNWAAHPEYAGSHNTALSSDFPHWLRMGVEEGAVGPDGTTLPGVGGTTVFYQGALGSQIGPNNLEQTEWDGTALEGDSLESAQTVGEQMAWLILDALGDGGGSVMEETAALGFRHESFNVRVQNRGYHVALLQSIFQPRGLFDFDPDLVISPRNLPSIRTEIAIVDVGRAQILMMPGEIDPSLWVGGYDGSFTPMGRTLLKADNPNPPNLAEAPDPPYLRDLVRTGADYPMLFGLGGDMIGYLVPEYDYVLHPTNPYLDEPPGDHYEETNSVGVDGWPTIRRHYEFLLRWTP